MAWQFCMKLYMHTLWSSYLTSGLYSREMKIHIYTEACEHVLIFIDEN